MTQSKYTGDNYYYQSAEKLLSTIIVKFNDIKQNHNFLVKRYDEVERAHQDLLHYIEFANFNVVEGYKVMKKLKDIRTERRLLKSEMEESEIAYKLIDNMVVEQLVKQFQQGQSDCKKAQLDFSKTYTPRNLDVAGINESKFKSAQDEYNKKLKENVVIFK